jgi:propionyl-CoA synthetase
MSTLYDQIYARSINDPIGLWTEAAEEIHWYKKWNKVLDESKKPFYRWFTGAEVNTCYNAIDRHVATGRGNQIALIYDSPVTQSVQSFTFDQLQTRVSKCAGALASLGVSKGDRVIIYMPMIPEAVVAMLATARLGAIHSVVFGGFASPELAARIDDAKPKVVLTASCGIEPGRLVAYKPLVDNAIDMAKHKPTRCVVYQRPMVKAELKVGRDIDWDETVSNATSHDCVPVAATDPLYILYTSGTTGQPKGIVRDNGGHLVALNWTMTHIYGVQPGEVYWAASDIGWVVGHSYIVYAPLIHGCTTVLFEGKPVGTPDAGVFWRVISDHNVVCLFTAPTAFRAIKREDPQGALIRNYNLSKFRTLFLAGERLDPDTLRWAEDLLRVPVIDHWWQTETGWPICANCVGLGQLPVKPGSATKPVPGWRIDVLNENRRSAKPKEIGSLVCKLPLPPGTFQTLWNADSRYEEAYLSEFPGYYKTGDAGFIDEEGYVFVMTRTDDVINVAGHRLSTGAIEEVLASHPDVAECAVVGVADSLKGQIPVGFLVLKAGVEPARETGIVQETVMMIRERIGPVAAFRTALVVKRLPKTRSGKILRGTMQKIAECQEYKLPATIDDPAALEEIDEALKRVGYGTPMPSK